LKKTSSSFVGSDTKRAYPYWPPEVGVIQFGVPSDSELYRKKAPDKKAAVGRKTPQRVNRCGVERKTEVEIIG
jgi:hypothetical protein